MFKLKYIYIIVYGVSLQFDSFCHFILYYLVFVTKYIFQNKIYNN